jgi:nitroimidazol reductase NimA-like FMN-containing flavoprotein (pyridoxamine 5'-phosphate oxidase superfamily)
MTTPQGSPDLLNDPIAQQLLHSTNPARLAYTWPDGSPRVVPIWFHWNGKEIILGSPPGAPKLRALQEHQHVAMTIDDNAWPYKSLLIRGIAQIDMLAGVAAEYEAAAQRYLGVEQGQAWVSMVGSLVTQMARIAVKPEWVGVIDFESRFPSAVERAMEAAGGQQAA